MKTYWLAMKGLLVGVTVLIITSTMSYAQTLSITYTKTPSAVRANAVDYQVKWTDKNAATNVGYHYIVNTESSFLITKRNAEPEPPITVRECKLQGLDAAAKYYIHIAPVDNRGTILNTESFKLFP